MNKKMLIIIVATIAFVGLIGGGLYYAFGTPAAPVEENKGNKKRIVEPENVIPVAERPYMKIVPTADGRNVQITVQSVKKPASEAEYLLEYQSGTLVQGQQGAFDLTSLPVTEKVFLGTCSAGGKCSFHEDVKGGTLRTRFSGSEAYVVKSDWKFIENPSKETVFSSTDEKFTVSSKELAVQKFLIIYNSPGYPDGLEGTPVSNPYSLEVSGTLSGKAQLTMATNDSENVVIMGWDGKAWKEFTATGAEGELTATVDLLPLYIAVSK